MYTRGHARRAHSPTMLAIATVGLCASTFAQDFGFSTMPARFGAHGVRDVLIVLMEYADTRFDASHTQTYFEDLLFTGANSLDAFYSRNSRGRFTFRRAGTLRVRHPQTLACAHRWNFCPQTVGGWGTEIALAPNGDIWMVNGANEIWHNKSGDWRLMPGRARAIDVGPSGTVFIVGMDTDVPPPDGRIHRWNGTRWDLVGGSGTRVAVGPGDELWIVNAFNRVWHYDGRWEQLSGVRARDIDVGADGSVYVIGADRGSTSGRVWKWDGSKAIDERGSGVRIIVDPRGDPWVIDAARQIWWKRDGSWGLWGGYARDFDITPTGDVAFIDVDSPRPGFPDGTVKRWTRRYAESDKQAYRHAYEEALEGVDASTLELSSYDRNGDGRLSDTELPILLINALPPMGGSNPFGGSGGINRRLLECATVGGTTLRVCPDAKIGVMAAGSGFATIAHEIAHTLGAIDVYGFGAGRNANLTLMGATVGANDVHEYYHLDPWHKMRLGWLLPRVIDISTVFGAQQATLSPPSGSGYSSILFYDGRRGTRDYFMVEYRRQQGLDENAADTGIAIWQIATDGERQIYNIPANVGDGPDKTMNHLGAPPGPIRGGNRLWRAAEGEIWLRWLDGTDSGVRLRVLESGGDTARVMWRGRTGDTSPRSGVHTFQPARIGPLCPTLTSGDREFNGHGPEVAVDATLSFNPDRTALNVLISMRATATEGDDSAASGAWSREVLRAPRGRRIAALLSDSQSSATGKSEPAEWSQSYRTRVYRWPVIGNLVSSFQVVGDILGEDIAARTDCSSGTSVTVDFNFVKVRYDE